jgi:hypothetical protein
MADAVKLHFPRAFRWVSPSVLRAQTELRLLSRRSVVGTFIALALVASCGVSTRSGFVAPEYAQSISAKKRIAVLEFRGNNDLAPSLADELSIHLLNAGLNVVDRGEVRLVLEQEGVSVFGDTSDVVAALRNKNNVDILLTGTLQTQMSLVSNSRISEGNMSVKVLDVPSGKTLLLQSFDIGVQWGGTTVSDLAETITQALVQK